MNLRDLEYLVALYEERHFRKAAEKCFVSQPTLSGQIKKLEDYLGVQLLERTKHKVLVTPVGEKIISRARVILEEANEIERIAQSYTTPMSGKVNVGIIPTMAPFILPLIVNPIKKKYPNLELLLYELQTEYLIQKLEQGLLDFGILALPIGNPEMEEKHLFFEPFFLAVAQGNKISRKKNIKISDLSDIPILLLEDGHCLSQQALEICSTVGAKTNEGFRATSLETLRHMVMADNGLTLLPQLAVQHYSNLKNEPIKYIPFQKPSPKRSVGIIYRKTTSRIDCIVNLAKLIREICEPVLETKNN